MQDKILKYYSRKDVQKAIVEEAKNREVAVRFTDAFGKRPDILQYPNDVYEFAKQGATSFHASEEHWSNPLNLQPGMSKKQLDELRIGWDLIIDLDSKFLEYSKIAALLLIEALKFHNIKNIGVKFSGNRSFHICIPFKSFSSKVNNIDIRLLFPEAPRTIASYLKQMIKSQLSLEILKLSTIEEIAKSTNKKINELVENNSFNPYSILEIDTILISSRHMYRMSYSFNEKSNLISIPIKISDIKHFKLSQAKPENASAGIKFFPEVNEEEASQLITQAFDWVKKEPIKKNESHYEQIKTTVKKDFFPPCINLLFEGIKQDGRKRSVFVLCNFLKNMNWSMQEIESLLLEWNKKNYEPLREGYIKSQVNWFKSQKVNILPPNCSNPAYYTSMGVCHPDDLCKKIKNPVNYSLRKLRFKKH